MNQICYRELKAYKYQLWNEYTIQLDMNPDKDIEKIFLSLSSGGLLTIRKGYAWDGPSGPTIDTKNFMRGSLVHDALYQLMRLGDLDYKLHRAQADEILRSICLADGMSSFRAWYVFKAVRWFAESSATPRPEQEIKVIFAP